MTTLPQVHNLDSTRLELFAYGVADLERFSPNTLQRAYVAAQGDGFLPLSNEDWNRFKRYDMLAPLSKGEHMRGESKLRQDARSFLKTAIVIEGATLRLRCPVPDTHESFQVVLQAFKSHGAHNQGTLKVYPEQ